MFFLLYSYNNTLASFLHQINFSHAIACSLYNVMLIGKPYLLLCKNVKFSKLVIYSELDYSLTFDKLKCLVFCSINCNLALPHFNVTFSVFFYPLTTTLSRYYCTSLGQLLVVILSKSYLTTIVNACHKDKFLCLVNCMHLFYLEKLGRYLKSLIHSFR